MQSFKLIIIFIISSTFFLITGPESFLSFLILNLIFGSFIWLILQILFLIFRRNNIPEFDESTEFIENNSSKFVSFKKTLINSSFIVSILFGILFSLIGFFAYYYNEISPGKLEILTLTNGEKNVVFHQMIHAGSENFYKIMSNSVKNYKKDGYILYYEGVRPGSQENNEKLWNIIGINIDNGFYDKFAEILGIVGQDNSLFLGPNEEFDKNIDISIDDIIEIYERDFGEFAINENSEVLDFNSLENLELSRLQKNVFGYLIKSLLSYTIQNKEIFNLGNNEEISNIYKVILYDRDLFLANEVIFSEDKNIVITYGAMHFEGFFEELKRIDEKYQITKREFVNIF